MDAQHARGLVGLVAVMLVLGGFERSARAQQPAFFQAPTTIADLQAMSDAQLEALYRSSPAAAMPAGRVRGTALLRTGTPLARPMSAGSRLVWQGKMFHPEESAAVNRFFGLPVVRAQVYSRPSLLDGQPALVLDYGQTSLVYQPYRDEIRQVAPGLLLGRMYDRRTAPPSLARVFALETAR